MYRKQAMRRIAVLAFLAFPLLCMADKLSLEDFDAAVAALEVENPVERDPVMLSTAVVAAKPGQGDTVIAVLKLRMLPGWYIYQSVPAEQPYIESEWILDVGPELEIVDNWAGPPATPHKELPFTRIHAAEGEDMVFFREMEVTDTGTGESVLTVGLRYQTCSSEYCLPPRTKKQDLTVRLVAEGSSK